MISFVLFEISTKMTAENSLSRSTAPELLEIRTMYREQVEERWLIFNFLAFAIRLEPHWYFVYFGIESSSMSQSDCSTMQSMSRRCCGSRNGSLAPKAYFAIDLRAANGRRVIFHYRMLFIMPPLEAFEVRGNCFHDEKSSSDRKGFTSATNKTENRSFSNCVSKQKTKMKEKNFLWHVKWNFRKKFNVKQRSLLRQHAFACRLRWKANFCWGDVHARLCGGGNFREIW